jgi:type II secretory pathway predicted ATPase ExeA
MTSKVAPETQTDNDSAHRETEPVAVSDPGNDAHPVEARAQSNPFSAEQVAHDLRGHVEQTDPGQISGWLYDHEHPGRQLTVEIVLDGVSIARQVANRPQQALLDTDIGDGRHGFALSLDKALMASAPHQLIAREYWTGWQLPGSPILVQSAEGAQSDESQLRGALDSVSDGRAKGWAFDPSRPDTKLQVEILNGDTVIMAGAANRFRQDLLDAGIGDGWHGFDLSTGALRPDGENVALSARILGRVQRLPFAGTRIDTAPAQDRIDPPPLQPTAQKPGLQPGNPRYPPFDNIRDTRFFFPSARHAEALSRLFMLSEDRNMGIAVLTGEIGAGKTLVRTLLFARLDPADYMRVSIENSLLDFDGLLLEIISQMQGERLATADYPDRYSLLALFKRLLLEEVSSRNRHLVVLIDEAQELSSATLRALKGLTNIAPENGSYLTLILIGQPELNGQLKRLPQVEQRVSQRFHLSNLDREETAYYIRHRLRAAGFRGEPPVTQEAIELIYHASKGTPREINRICKLAVNYRLTHGCGELDAEAVKAVTDDLREHGSPRRIKTHF